MLRIRLPIEVDADHKQGFPDRICDLRVSGHRTPSRRGWDCLREAQEPEQTFANHQVVYSQIVKKQNAPGDAWRLRSSARFEVGMPCTSHATTPGSPMQCSPVLRLTLLHWRAMLGGCMPAPAPAHLEDLVPARRNEDPSDGKLRRINYFVCAIRHMEWKPNRTLVDRRIPASDSAPPDISPRNILKQKGSSLFATSARTAEMDATTPGGIGQRRAVDGGSVRMA
ncbi:hypothetical protein VTI74DRAFT_10946 [Chaetomium olivicolor]